MPVTLCCWRVAGLRPAFSEGRIRGSKPHMRRSGLFPTDPTLAAARSAARQQRVFSA
jgi:hypothetical protein